MKNYNKYLGNDEVTDYTRTESKRMSQETLEEAYNNYFNGNIADFKGTFKSINEFAQFLNYVIDAGTDVRVIREMINTLS